jgi:hypothetical protein
LTDKPGNGSPHPFPLPESRGEGGERGLRGWSIPNDGGGVMAAPSGVLRFISKYLNYTPALALWLPSVFYGP